MPALSIDKTEAIRETAEVENALFDGFPMRPLHGSHKLGAIRVAAENIGVCDQTLRGRIGYPERPGSNVRNFGVEVDWSIFRAAVQTPKEPLIEAVSAQEHADARSGELGRWIKNMMGATRYPVINPEALIVEPRIDLRYNRQTMEYIEVERAPRTWVSDTLRVEPVLDSRGKTFIFTGAQNDCMIHEAFWLNLQAYAKYIRANIVIGPWTYETAWFNESNASSRAYDDRISEYISFGRMEIGNNFVFCAEMNTLPTASRPISNITTYSRGRFAVFPHAKVQLKSVPSTDPDFQAHQVMTTGAVTLPKVAPRKAGVVSIFHHVIGAVLVEFDQAGNVFCRQINAVEDGSFYDLDRHVSGGQVTSGHRIKALVCGDVHVRKIGPSNALATFGLDISGGPRYINNMVDSLKPEYIILHDVFDNETRNHHHSDDSAYFYEMAIRGRDRVMDEVKDAAKFISSIRRDFSKLVVIDSNHDLGLEQYVREGRYRKDGANVRPGLQLEDAYMAHRERVAAALDRNDKPPTFSMFEYAARNVSEDDLAGVEWVHDGKSFLVDDVECGHHGFRGANGSKGSISGFARMGHKMSIGDKHSPEIMDGVYCAGVMNLQQGYNKGPSSWAISNILQYVNGKRSIVTLQNGQWRAERPRLRVRSKMGD